MNFFTFEIFLIILCFLLIYISIKIYIKNMVLRYLLINQMDWAKYKIDELSEAAEHTIIEQVKYRFSHYDDEMAKMYVPTVISTATKEWFKQCDNIGNSLKRNEMKMLNNEDAQFLLSTFYK